MSDDNSANRPRRASLTSAAFSAIFGPRNNISNGSTNAAAPRPNGSTTNGSSSVNGGTATTPPHPTTNSRRRMSISTLGLSGSPININPTPSFFPRDRRASTASTVSTVSSSIPSSSISESAIEDDSPDTAHSVPTTPFTRHMSFGGSSTLFPRANANNNNNTNGTSTSPQKSRSPSDSPGLNWSEQFRERAASAVHRPQMGSSPPAAHNITPHVRARSEGGGDMAGPQVQTQVQIPTQTQVQSPTVRKERRKPDEVGERMLRGEFYMD